MLFSKSKLTLLFGQNSPRTLTEGTLVQMRRREQRNELARCVPELPDQMPAPVRGKPRPLSQVVEPYVEALYNNDPEFRTSAASINAENSPNGRVCFDDADMARRVKADAVKDHGNPRIVNALLGELSRAIKYCMTRRGVGRMQRLKAARNNLLGSAQPAE